MYDKYYEKGMKNPLELVKKMSVYWQDDQRMLFGGGFEEWVVIYLAEMGVSVCIYGLGFYL